MVLAVPRGKGDVVLSYGETERCRIMVKLLGFSGATAAEWQPLCNRCGNSFAGKPPIYRSKAAGEPTSGDLSWF
jgi:hypothetical protein